MKITKIDPEKMQYANNHNFVISQYRGEQGLVIGYYDLNKDNILLQSDEFCEFMLDLLNNK